MGLVRMVSFRTLGDDRGSLISLEAGRNIPFDIRRVYYIFGTKSGVARGFHAHKSLKQVAVCLAGSCRFVLDDGRERTEVILNSPGQGLMIEDMTWREMHDFSSNCVLMVLADQHYDESDYIRDYEIFMSMAKQ